MGRSKPTISRKAKEFGWAKQHRDIPFDQRTLAMQEQIRRSQRTVEEKHEDASYRQRKTIEKYGHPRGSREIRTCPICNQFFDVRKSNPKQFCSRDCAFKQPRAETTYTRGKGGKRKDLKNQYFRSRYEANYARYLNFLIKNGGDITKWEYEPDTFSFEKIKRGVRFYTPDFKVWFPQGIEYHEVKGWDYPRGKTARKRMAKYYPNVKLVLIEQDFFQALKKQGIAGLIPNWESQK